MIMNMKILCTVKSAKTTDEIFFLCSTQQIITVQKLSHACFIQILLSSKNNKNKPLKALELHLTIFLQDMHGIYFSRKYITQEE